MKSRSHLGVKGSAMAFVAQGYDKEAWLHAAAAYEDNKIFQGMVDIP